MARPSELSDITGIGPARARWLEVTFGVRSFRDLAALSPDDIERKLKAKGRVGVSRRTIESWVAEARAKASEEKPTQERAALAKHPGRMVAAERPDEWKPVASFVVEFQAPAEQRVEGQWRTAVHHIEGDRTQAWSGLSCEQLCEWMIEQLRTATASEATGARSGDVQARVQAPPLSVPLHAYVVDGDGVEHTNLIRIDKPWAVVFSWSLEELPSAEEEGVWQLDVPLRPVGPGKSLRLRKQPLRLPSASLRVDGAYRARFEVRTGVVTSSHVEGLYRASATLLFRPEAQDRAGRAAFTDLGLLRFYDPREPLPRFRERLESPV
jgi:hypothetical protein